MFQKKLKELREKAGLSQQALAEKLFISRSAIAKWENGNGIPSDVNLDAICSLFEVTKNELFGDELISEFRNAKISRFKYKKGLMISIILSSIIIVLICSFYIVQQHKHKYEYERYKEMMKEQAKFNEPIKSFGDIPELYLKVIEEKILYDDNNVFLDDKYIYVVTMIVNRDFCDITRYDYSFNIVAKFQYFLHNGIGASIDQIKTTIDDGILIVCNHNTYFEGNTQYNGYSKITKYDKNYKITWEYTFTNGENNINSVFEYNDNYYVFTNYSNFREGYSRSVTDIKIYKFSQNGYLLEEKYVTKGEYGWVDFVIFENEIFYIYGSYQPTNDSVYNVWEYSKYFELINKYESEKFLEVNTYKSSNGIITYYNDSPLIIGKAKIPNSYGEIKLRLNFEEGYLLVFNNFIDYDWDFIEEHPYLSLMHKIVQTVYLFIDLNGNVVWCKG